MAAASDDCTFTARWLFPVAGPPLVGGILTVRDGRITAVLDKGQRSGDIDFGNAAILPGFVNAHTHLDLTGLCGKCPPTEDFTSWLRGVIAHRRLQTREQIEADIRTGIAESLSHGVTLIGDIAGQGWSWPLLAESSLRATVFYELLGLSETRASPALQAARAWVDGLPPSSLPPNSRCRPGLSPHAPYSVCRSLFLECARLGLPLAVHLAETRAELELLNAHTGPFRPFLEDLGVWDEAGLVGSAADVIALCERTPSHLFVHANYLDPATPLPAASTVVYCPRTHAAFGHEEHPFREFLRRGVAVALGTDSLASNPDLSVLAEARFLHNRYPEIRGDELLRMITLNGADALGWGSEVGSLAPDKSADFVVLPLTNDDADPYCMLFESDEAVQRVFIAGAEPRP